MTRLDEVLSYLEDHLSAQAIARSVADVKAALRGEGTRHCMKLAVPCDKFQPYPYREAFYDMEKMMVNELISESGAAYPAASVRTDMLPMLRANYGVGQLPSLFGVECVLQDSGMPWVDRQLERKEIAEIAAGGKIDVMGGLGQRMADTQYFYREALSRYPLCNELIRVYHPDLQGVFDTAHLLIGTDIYYMMYDDAPLLHDFLSVIADTYIRLLEKLRETLDDTEDGFCYHWGTLFCGGVVLRDDTAVNVSEEQFQEFVMPYEARVLRHFGGGSIHFCGQGDQWLDQMLAEPALLGVNFGQPPGMVFGAEFLKNVRPAFEAAEKCILNYGVKADVFEEVMDLEMTQNVTYAVGCENAAEAERMMRRGVLGKERE